MWRNNRAGFTLIELLIGLTLWAITAITLAHLFQNGLRLWKRMENVTLLQQEARGVLEQIARDVRQGLDVPGIGWSGSNERVSFATLAQAKILKVTYQMDAGVLQRQTQLLSSEGMNATVSSTLTQHPAAIKWEYAYATPQAPLEWLDHWKAGPGDGMPCGIRIHLTLSGESADPETFTKTILLPMTRTLPWAT
jgi:prepilin-type N-terminal cleavage/methylation domain-containing protein